ncbi:MAG: hypothetical protein N2037_10345 [Acidimicrobiales bacterium]|nr:hypothetical protein [Acidimicrobiales bacterium]
MTDLATRPPELEVASAAGRKESSLPPKAGPVRQTTTAARFAVAGLSAAAGAIHLAMAPSHFGESTGEGLAFLGAGWFQLFVAVAVARPHRWLLAVTATANVAFIAAWAVTRTVGSPWGAHAGHPEAAGFVDLTCVGLEAVLVLICVGLLARQPRVAETGPGNDSNALAVGPGAFIVPVAAAILATAAIASPSARDHAAASHGGHSGSHLDAESAAAGHDHAATGADSDSHDHAHGVTDVDDKGFSLLSNGHQHDNSIVELDPETQAKLDAQLEGTKQLIDKYPTIAAAEAAGYRRAGPFAPGLGIHYQPPQYHLNPDGVIDEEDLPYPMLIFDGWEPDAKLAGFMYQVFSQTEPEGFAGPNDHWHYHSNVCIVPQPDGTIDTPFGADLPGVTKEMCDGVGGRWVGFTGYMVHVWTVPGYESDRGVFSELNPAITCPDGTYYILPIEEIAWRKSACRDS